MIIINNVSKEYVLSKSEKIQVLSNININIQKWEFVAIMWPSWSWKSTLMNIIWLLDKPSSWEYYLDTIRVDTLKESKLATIRGKKIWFIFQNYSLLPRLSAIQQIWVILSYQWIYWREAKQIWMHYLDKVWLADKYKNKPNELSWWQSQRVAIARALAVKPDILLADEPTWALDSKTWEDILTLFQTLNTEWKTVIMITHDLNVASYASRIIKIKDWQILSD